VGFGPIHHPPQRPEVDDVAEQENGAALVVLEKSEKALRLTGARAKMDVGEKQRANPILCAA
jgi:hypothetical protein